MVQMKRLFFILTCAISVLFTLSSCKSKEQQAEALINDYIFKHLHDYASYEAVETKVDSAYNSPYYDNLILLFADEAIDFEKDNVELKEV